MSLSMKASPVSCLSIEQLLRTLLWRSSVSMASSRSCTRVRYHSGVCNIIGAHCGEFGRRGMSLQRLRKYVRGVEQASEQLEKKRRQHGDEGGVTAQFPPVILVVP